MQARKGPHQCLLKMDERCCHNAFSIYRVYSVITIAVDLVFIFAGKNGEMTAMFGNQNKHEYYKRVAPEQMIS